MPPSSMNKRRLTLNAEPFNMEGESAKKVVLFRDYYEKVWLPEKRRSCKSTTLAGYMGYFRKYLLPEFGDYNLYDIRPFDIQEYFQSIPHLTLKTQKEHYNVLSNLFDYAMDDENVALPRNPVKSKCVKVKYSESDSVIREPLPSPRWSRRSSPRSARFRSWNAG